MLGDWSKYVKELRVASLTIDFDDVTSVTEMIREAKRVYIIGNGGSASTASHFAVDLFKLAGVKVTALCDNIGMMTALSNDIHFTEAFCEEVSGYCEDGDVLVVISVSGDSLNLVRAVQQVKHKDVKVVGILGRKGQGTVKHYCDVVVSVDSNDYGICEDLHLAICHSVTRELAKGRKE